MPRCLPLRGAQTHRFRAIPEICALAQSLPHTCCAPCSKVFPGKAETTATLFIVAILTALAVATSRSSLTPCSSRSESQCLRSSCELRPLPRIRCPACCRARRFIPPCPQISAWVEQGRRERRRERQRERQREQQQQ